MIFYEATRAEFASDVTTNQIELKILGAFRRELGHSTTKAEIDAWRNSMMYMHNALNGAGVPGDAGVAIEYRVPQTAKRVDFILTGLDATDRDTAVIVELKQWSTVNATYKDGIVETFIGKGMREVLHPSYQAWSYAWLIKDYNEAAHDDKIALHPCAYLHNLADPSPLRESRYRHLLLEAPIFARRESDQLEEFLRKHIRRGDRKRVLYKIESGKIRPSKNLADHLASLLAGNREFVLVDEQKLVYESALAMAREANRPEAAKQVLIIEGGPGTGKSVVAINLLVELTKRGMVTQYVTRNAAPREVYEQKLTGSMTATRIRNLLKSSGNYIDARYNSIDALVVDEAHRLNEKSGLYANLGEHQVKEIIRAARFTIFFVDDDQRVTLKDIGSTETLRRIAQDLDAVVTEGELSSQFRCNGSDAYLAWLDNLLRIRPTAHTSIDDLGYDFRVFDSPVDLHQTIRRLNAPGNKSRLVAGYCWDWKGKRNPEIKDISIPEHGYEARWNLDRDGSLWIIQPDSVDEVGCIHTCQGLELDYVGVIIGPDLVVRDGAVITDAAKRSGQDRSVHGYKGWLRRDPAEARATADRIIKNTYRTLMTRGQKGCYVFSTDPETNAYLRQASVSGSELPLNLLKAAEEQGSFSNDDH